MKVKNLNPIERHVEKVVLAVAVAAAAYLGWQGMEPTRIGPNKDIGPGDVEQRISDAIENLKKGAAKTEEQIRSGALSVEVENYQADYQRKAGAGLPVRLTQSDYRFLPMQAEGTAGPKGPVDQHMRQFAIDLPIPDPVNVHTAAGRGRVLLPAPGAATLPAGGVAVKATIEQDATVVRISANYPLQELRDKIANVRDTNPWHRLDTGLQFVSLYRLEVQRQERLPDGTWPTDEASWKPVTGLKNSKPLDPIPFAKILRDQLKDAVALINAAAATILEPPMYDTGDHGFFPPLPEAPGAATTTAPAVVTPRAAPPAGPQFGYPGGGGPPSFGPTGMPPGMFMGPNGPQFGPGPTGMPPGVTPGVPPSTPSVVPTADAARILGDAAPAVWAYDEDVKPEHEYQYRMRLQVVNPLYKYPRPQDLKDPTSIAKPLLETAWVLAPEKVIIKPSSYFFVNNSGMGKEGKEIVDIQIYKFSLGVWYTAWQREVRAGTFIGDAVVPTGSAPKTVDFSTGYTVVDVLPSGNDAMVVLLSPGGQLVTRNSREDRDREHELQADIEAEAKKAGTPIPGSPLTPATMPRTPVPVPLRTIPGPGPIPGMRGGGPPSMRGGPGN